MKRKAPKPPPGLLPESRKYWKTIHEELAFNAGESGIMMTLIRNYDLGLRCLAEIQRDGVNVASDRTGVMKKNPAIDLYRVATSAYLQACRLLGLKENLPK